jgi:hypothetical protein
MRNKIVPVSFNMIYDLKIELKFIFPVRRPRFPYRFKHHTVNLLTSGTENKLISTDVLMGKFNDRTKRKASSNSVVLATAVIGRSSSAPRLQTYNAGDELTVNGWFVFGTFFYKRIVQF